MSEPSPSAGRLLRTKLYAPRVKRQLVDRPRLVDVGRPALLLVSAPAGFGKSTLLAQVLARDSGPSVAWLSLDSGDSDPALFWAYVLAAIRTAAPEVGDSARALLEAPGGTPITSVLTSLLNDLAATDHEVVLVLDDYHVVHDPGIHEAMAFLVDHLPVQLRLVIATRSDPPLPLPRLRARGELVEVRAGDLRFTEQETAAYLRTMGLDLTAGAVSALEGRTEGWAAALQLAALSLQGREDAAGFIDGFAGDDRHVVDYLVEEVVHRQPDAVRDFLLRTSVLPRLSGSLVDAVTGGTDGRAMLERLERDNLFLVPLDDQRRWYRYHHLFADMLQARLLDELPGEAPELHRRASRWHEDHGGTSAAIDHALAAGDADRAAALVEAVLPAMTRERREAQLRRWMEALPDEVYESRPVLANGYVGALMSTGETRGVEPRLRLAEAWVDATVESALRCPPGRRPGRPRGRMAPAPGNAQDPPRRADADGRGRRRDDAPQPGGPPRARARRRPGPRCGHGADGPRPLADGGPGERGGGVRRDRPAVRARRLRRGRPGLRGHARRPPGRPGSAHGRGAHLPGRPRAGRAAAGGRRPRDSRHARRARRDPGRAWRPRPRPRAAPARPGVR